MSKRSAHGWQGALGRAGVVGLLALLGSSPARSQDAVGSAGSAGAAPAEQFDMVFHCQLAHGSPTRQVRDFTNVKQLYESIAKAFGVPTSDVR